MKVLLQLALCGMLATCAFGQGRGGGMRGGGGGFHGGGHGFGGGFGRGGFGGGFGHGFGRGGFGGGFGRGGFIGGFGHGFGGGFGRFGFGGFRRGFGFGRSFVGFGFGTGFYGYPYYVGGYYDPFYDDPFYSPYYGPSYAPSYYPNVTVVAPYSPAPPVVLQERVETARPVMREYRDEYGQNVAPSATAGKVIYLIAFNDGIIRAALTYWVDGNTLHYVDLQHAQKTAPRDTVDRAFSEQLNRDRHVPFQLQ